MHSRTLTVGCIALALLSGAGALAFAQAGRSLQPVGQAQPRSEAREDKDGEVISLNKVPEAVRAAAIKLAGDAKNISRVIKEEDDEDVVTYEVEYTEGAAAVKCAAIFSVGGELMEMEKSVTEAKLPPTILAALKQDYPKATFADPQFVTKMFYEIEVVIDGKKHEVRVDASGNIEDETKGGDEHGKGAHREKDRKPEHREEERD